jgi:hypoxanthine phosphoribosyltransferase
MTNPEILISRQEIKKTIAKLAEQLRKDYEGKNPILISVLKGSAVFFADLIRELNIPLQIEFMQVSSYGSGTESSGKIKVVQRLRTDIKDRHVLVVEDIVDTGNTLSYLLKYLSRKKPASLKLCTLTDKPSRRKVPVKIDYLGFTVPDKFIVGYGIDFNEEYRYLPDICVIN